MKTNACDSHKRFFKAGAAVAVAAAAVAAAAVAAAAVTAAAAAATARQQLVAVGDRTAVVVAAIPTGSSLISFNE